MTTENRQPLLPDDEPANDTPPEDDQPHPPHKDSEWRKKAGTDEAYEPTMPVSNAPDLLPMTDEPEQDSEDDEDDIGRYPTPATVDTNAPGLNAATDYQQKLQEEQDDEDDEPTLDYEIDFEMQSDDVTSNAPNISETQSTDDLTPQDEETEDKREAEAE